MSRAASGRVTHEELLTLPGHRAPNTDAPLRIQQLGQEFVHLPEAERDRFFESMSPAERNAVGELLHRRAAGYRQQAAAYAAAADSLEDRVVRRTRVSLDEIARESAERRSVRRPARRRFIGRKRRAASS
jgi:hypothetical protein